VWGGGWAGGSSGGAGGGGGSVGGRSVWGRSLWGRSLWGRSLWGRSLRGGRTGEPAGRQHGRGKKPGETAAGEHGPPSPSRPLRREGARLPARLDLFARGYCRLSGRTTRNRASRPPATRCIPGDAAGRSLLFCPAPVASGGRSASLLTVFLPTCPPPLSRNIA